MGWRLQLLVDASDDPMLKNYEGETPLHFAPDCYRYSSLYPSQLEDSAKPYVGIILSRWACLSEVEWISRKQVEWATSEALVFWPNPERWLICGESRGEGRKGGNRGWGLRVEDPGLRWRGALLRNHRPRADIDAGTNHSNYNPYSTTSHPVSKPST